MIYLTATTDKIQVTTSAAGTVDVVASYIEAVTSGLTTPTAGRQLTAISTATDSDVLSAPGASNTRTLKTLSVRNKDTTLTNDVTVKFNANGTVYEIHKATLYTGDLLEYIEGIGFFVVSAAAKLDVWKSVASDVTNATTSFADITGLTQDLKSGKKYAVTATLFHTNNASTTGSQFGYNIGASPTLALFGNVSTVTNSVTAAAFSSGTATAVDTALTAQTTGQTATGITLLNGFIQPSADGTFAMRCKSEVAVASGLVVKAGSWMNIRELDS